MQRARLAVSLLVLSGLAATAAQDPWAEAAQRCEAALVAKRAGQYDVAERQFKQALALDPKLIEARWALAWIYAEQGRKELSAEQFRLVIATVPGTSKADEAVKGLERLGQPLTAPPVKVNPLAPPPVDTATYNASDDANWRANPVVSAEHAQRACAQGVLFKQLGKYDEAIEAISRALRFDPELPEAHWMLAWLLAEKGQKEAAGKEFRLVLRYAAGTPRAEQALDALTRLGLPIFEKRPDQGPLDIKSAALRGYKTITSAANPLWTPDGNHLVFTRAHSGLALADGDGGNPRLLAKGLRLLALTNDGQTAFAMPLDKPTGSLSLVRLADGQVKPFAPTLVAKINDVIPSPDSKAILVIAAAGSTERGEKSAISLVSADGATVKSLPAGVLSSEVKWSADSSVVLWSADAKVHLTSAAGEDKVLAEGAWCDWLANTGKILVRATAGDLMVTTTEGAALAKLVTTVKDLRVDRAWASPSGKWVLYRENGRSWGLVRIADQMVIPLGEPQRPIADAYWLNKVDQVMVADRSMMHSDDRLWTLYDPEAYQNTHSVVQEAYIWGRLAISGDGKLAAYWQAMPNGLLTASAPATRLMFSGRLVVGATDSPAKLSPMRVTEKSEGSGAGVSWSSRGDAVAFWLPATQTIGVLTLGKK